jgi:hypothetical protein
VGISVDYKKDIITETEIISPVEASTVSSSDSVQLKSTIFIANLDAGRQIIY